MHHHHLLAPFLLTAAATAQLAGAYTVNPTLPTAGTNFASLAAATAALTAQGVAGPVDFLLYDDAGPFTESAPFVTANGQYPPSNAVLTMTSWTGTSSTNRVTFRPAPGEFPVFDASGHAMGVFWGGADYVTLQGIEIKNALFDAISLYAEATHGIAQDPIIDRCVLHDCTGAGVTIYGNVPQPANTLVQNCVMYRLQTANGGAFAATARFGYVTTRRSNGTRVVHNTFIADTGTGSAFCVLGALPSSTTEVPYAEFSNNIVVKSIAATAPIVRITGVAGSTLLTPTVSDSNCFFDVSAGPFAIWGVNGATTSATLLDWQTNALRDQASIQGDPLFRDTVGRDYHLTAASPCRGAAIIAANVAVDFDGQPRLAPIEIGADEWSAATWSAASSGCAGSGNLTPALGNTWPFLGNPAYSLRTTATPPGAITALFGSLALAGIPIPLGAGCSVLLDPPSLTSLAVALASPAGTTAVTFAVPANPAFIGFRIGYQSLVLDGGAALGFTVSNALDVTFDF